MDPRPERAAAAPSVARELLATRLDIAGRQLLAEAGLGFHAERVDPGFLGLRSRDGRVALLEHDVAQPLRLLAGLARVRERAYPARQIVVFGGGAALRQRLTHDLAGLGEVWVLHCEAGALWSNRAPRRAERRSCAALERAASQALTRSSWSAADADAHRQRLERDREQARAEARQLDRFRRLLAQRRPRATVALMLTIALVFGLEALWGGVDLPPLLSAMGSLVPERAWAGEWWRFFASGFLHGGPLHVGLNLLVLWMLGRSLERAIGTTRFLVVYFAAALGGAVASSLVVEGQSVGASGAIWGLLGAEAVMAFYPQPLLPPVLLPVARRTALVNLGINLLASFVPRVDVAAHIGGGIAGALVLLALARWRQLAVQSPEPRAPHVALRALAALGIASFAVALSTAWLEGRPWRLALGPELERVSWAGLPWSVEIPRGYATAAVATADGQARESLELGDLRHDPSLIQLHWASLTQSSARSELEAELTELARELRSLEGLEVLAPARLHTEPGARGGDYISVRYRYAQNPEIVDDWAIGVREGVRVRVHVSAWAALESASEGLAARILQSFERRASGRAAPQGVGGVP